MSKFNTRATKTAAGKGFIATGTGPTGHTYEGVPGYSRDPKSELFLLAVSNMVGENAFYEAAGIRDARYAALIHQVAVADPEWTGTFLSWLRSSGNMRSASLVGALEAAKAMVAAKVPGSRAIVDSVLQRGDEPSEAVGYWLSTHGKKMPKPVKRGIADAAERLYTEYAVLRYDTASRGIRFGDVLNLVHPNAKAPWQEQLYKFILARQHNRDEAPGELLMMVRAQAAFRAAVAAGQNVSLDSDTLKAAGMTWEDTLSLLGSKGDKGALWEALIPTMGYMALLRNLRNFDNTGVSDRAARYVADRLADPAEVEKSRQFPFRFLSAHRATAGMSLRWGQALETALSHSVRNIPALSGRTLVLVDRSGSMFGTMSGKTELTRADAAAVFGGALALRNAGRVTLVEFGTDSRVIDVPTGRGSLLKLVEKFTGRGGTNTATAVRKHFAGHDRVIIVTDEQAHDGDPGNIVPATTPLYVWNLAGYRLGHSGGPRRYAFGGLTEHSFGLIPLLEAGVDGTWPWDQVA